MFRRTWILCSLVLAGGALLAGGCSDDSEADERGVGAACSTANDCTEEGQACLTNFKGGYCGVADCQRDADCPEGSRCVAHDDGTNYCFLLCVDKPDCNAHRHEDVWANCSANVVFVDQPKAKACVPPSG